MDLCTKEIYTESLKKFKFRTCVGIAHYDLSVCFPQACCTNFNPYQTKGFGNEEVLIIGNIGFSEEYNLILNSEKIKIRFKKENEDIFDNNLHSFLNLKMMFLCNELFNRRIDVNVKMNRTQILLNLVHDSVICKGGVGFNEKNKKEGINFIKKIVKIIKLDCKYMGKDLF